MSAHGQSETGVARVDSRLGAADAPTAVLVVEVGGHRCGLPAEVVIEPHRMVASLMSESSGSSRCIRASRVLSASAARELA